MPTKIEWCQETINPFPGCSKVSEGCKNCYALRMANRFKRTEKYHGLVKNGEWTGRVNYWASDLEKPLRWKKPRRIFVNSMGDLFHQSIDVGGLGYDAVMQMVRRCPQHTFLFLTKRSGKMEWVCRRLWKNDLPKNVWFGITAENQRRLDERTLDLLKIIASVRIVSFEPLLGPIDARRYLGQDGINWTIVGGESGPGARPMNPAWVRSLRDQCVSTDVPFLFKQWGEWVDELHPAADSVEQETDNSFIVPVGDDYQGLYMCRAGKKAAGRRLDGRKWEQYPDPIQPI